MSNKYLFQDPFKDIKIGFDLNKSYFISINSRTGVSYIYESVNSYLEEPTAEGFFILRKELKIPDNYWNSEQLVYDIEDGKIKVPINMWNDILELYMLK